MSLRAHNPTPQQLAILMRPDELAFLLQEAVRAATEPLEHKIDLLRQAYDEKEDETLTMNQVCDRLQRCRGTVSKMINDGSLKAVRRSGGKMGRYYILASEVRRFQINDFGTR